MVKRMPHAAIARNHVIWRWMRPACPAMRTVSKGSKNAYVPTEASTGQRAVNTAAADAKTIDRGNQSTRVNFRVSENLELARHRDFSAVVGPRQCSKHT